MDLIIWLLIAMAVIAVIGFVLFWAALVTIFFKLISWLF